MCCKMPSLPPMLAREKASTQALEGAAGCLSRNLHAPQRRMPCGRFAAICGDLRRFAAICVFARVCLTHKNFEKL
jgi:hypothetical protein